MERLTGGAREAAARWVEWFGQPATPKAAPCVDLFLLSLTAACHVLPHDQTYCGVALTSDAEPVTLTFDPRECDLGGCTLSASALSAKGHDVVLETDMPHVKLSTGATLPLKRRRGALYVEFRRLHRGIKAPCPDAAFDALRSEIDDLLAAATDTSTATLHRPPATPARAAALEAEALQTPEFARAFAKAIDEVLAISPRFLTSTRRDDADADAAVPDAKEEQAPPPPPQVSPPIFPQEEANTPLPQVSPPIFPQEGANTPPPQVSPPISPQEGANTPPPQVSPPISPQEGNNSAAPPPTSSLKPPMTPLVTPPTSPSESEGTPSDCAATPFLLKRAPPTTPFQRGSSTPLTTTSATLV